MTAVAKPRGRRTWSQWSCSVAVTVDDHTRADDAATLVSSLMEEVDLAASRFRGDSELAVCNLRAGRATLMGPLLNELLCVALAAARRTDGLVDPTTARHLESAGYDRDLDEIRASGIVRMPARPADLPDWTRVVHDAVLGLVVVPSGLGLDLGATAKAWTVDRALQLLTEHGHRRVLVEIGGDIGAVGAEQDPFVVRAAERAAQPGELVALSHGALATSTTAVRRWGSGPTAGHHVIDPRTGRPCRGRWRTASVWAPTAVLANTASTAAVVVGEVAPDWLHDRGFAARLVDRRGEVHHTSGWPLTEAIAS